MKTSLYNTKFKLFSLFLGLFLFTFTTNVVAQDAPTGKTIKIVTVTVDGDGNEVENIIVLEGEDAENVNIEDLIEEHTDGDFEDVEIDVDIQQGGAFGSDEKGKRIIKKRMRHGTDNKAFLGVMMKNVNGVTGNAVEIVPGSAAEKAGLKNGDVIQSINNQSINNFDDLVKLMGNFKGGDVIDIKYLRDGKVQTTKATLTSTAKIGNKIWQLDNGKNNSWSKGSCGTKSKSSCCSKTKSVNKAQLGVYINDVSEGVKISEIIKGTAAERAALLANDIIYKIDKTDIKNTDGLIKLISNHEVGDEIKVRYIRDGKNKSVKVILAGKAKQSCNRVCWDNCSDKCKEKCSKDKQSFNEREIIFEEENELFNTENELNEIVEDIVIENRNNENTSPLKLENFNLYPNPTGGIIKVAFQLDNTEPIIVNIADVTGRVIYTEMIKDFTGSYEAEINLDQNPDGNYFFIVLQEENTYTEQILLRRN